MSQPSLGGFGSLGTQVETFKIRDIYEKIRDRDPTKPVWPKEPDYASHVRKVVLERMNMTEEKLNEF